MGWIPLISSFKELAVSSYQGSLATSRADIMGEQVVHCYLAVQGYFVDMSYFGFTRISKQE